MKKRKLNENLIYLFIWMLVLMVPVFSAGDSDQLNWRKVLLEWIRILPFFLIFIINNSLLLPKFLLAKKTKLYILSVTLTILAFSYLSNFSKEMHDLIIQSARDLPPPHHRFPPPKPLSQLLIDKVIFSFLIVGFNNAVKLLIQRQKDDKKQEEREKIHLSTELSMLRQQISPHFFMNTLNNIHSLIDSDKEKAQESVIQLSRLMRILLSGTEKGFSSIKNEFEFLESYIDLMKLRVSETLMVQVDLNVTEPDKQIPSLLFISLVENAFKYGVSIDNDSYIIIKAETVDNALNFRVRNSIHSENKKPGTGLGLKNLEKQLALMFEKNYTFELEEKEKEFSVNLKIPLNGNKLYSN